MKQKRWIKAVIATSQQDLPVLPFQHGHRAALKAQTPCQTPRQTPRQA